MNKSIEIYSYFKHGIIIWEINKHIWNMKIQCSYHGLVCYIVPKSSSKIFVVHKILVLIFSFFFLFFFCNSKYININITITSTEYKNSIFICYSNALVFKSTQKILNILVLSAKYFEILKDRNRKFCRTH